MPGMAASDLIFENIQLDENLFDVNYMHWIIPLKNEPIQDYAKRLLDQIKDDNPVMIGVSFGGMLVQEIAKQIKVRKTIIISSAKNNTEFPWRMQLCKKTGIHKLAPTGLFENLETVLKYSFGLAPKRLDLYKKYLDVNDRRYLDWALDTIINWDQEESPKGITHIHGDKDLVFPVKYIKDAIIIKGGTHVMIVNRFRWFNDNLPQIILQ